ncbi:CTP synthase [bacterium]|nr:CTP synthase [candidate division CSSED10-310 bacterium]
MQSKYIFVTGGVVSSLGKGIASSSIGALLESRGFRVTHLKFDPYLNVDPGTMSPFQHGEVYVTDDGAETDLDLGHYERFTHAPMRQINNVTAGAIYHAILAKERRGDFLGGTVQVVPHVTDEIKSRIGLLSKDVDVVIVELGGTIGDIESLPFLEAIRQYPFDVGKENCIYIHLTLVPYIRAARELKTKPTQHSVKSLREIGIQPDILLCRSEMDLDQDIKRKIAMFCNVAPEAVITARDVESIYEVPVQYAKEALDSLVIRYLGLEDKPSDLTSWEEIVHRLTFPKRRVTIGVIGKYVQLKDSYKSLAEAFVHGGIANEAALDMRWIDAERIEVDGPERYLSELSGILVPGGFGDRGIEGKIATVRFARENRIPYFGICLGMQCAVIEFARNICGLAGANSSEFDPSTPAPVIDLLPWQKDIKNLGGTLRLGAYRCALKTGSKAWNAYKSDEIKERHRHRYEFNNQYRSVMESNGMEISGLSPDGTLVEIVELTDHPWFVAVQFHPEFKSTPRTPHPLFVDFVKAALHKGGVAI